MQRKERSIRGTTNLSARSDGKDKTAGPQEFYRSWTHKLISPDVYNPPEKPPDPEYIYKKTATWRPVNVYEREYTTTAKDSYNNPEDRPAILDPHSKSSEQIAKEEHTKKSQNKALEALVNVAKIHYGTTASMMKAFNKRTSDDISLYELTEYLKRNKIEKYISPAERQLIFDSVDPNNKGCVPVREFLRKTEEQEFRDGAHMANMNQLRSFLQEHVEEIRKHRHARGHHKHSDHEHRKKKKAVKGEKDMIKKALGQKTFDIDVDHDELHEAIEHLFSKPMTDHNHAKFARFLRHSNLNLSTIQFYDMRNEELEALKSHAARIDQQYDDPQCIDKYLELEPTRFQASLATTNALIDNQTLHDPAYAELLKYPQPNKVPIASAATKAAGAAGTGAGAGSNVNNNAIDASAQDGAGAGGAGPSSPQQPPVLSVSKSLPILPMSARPSPLAPAVSGEHRLNPLVMNSSKSAYSLGTSSIGDESSAYSASVDSPSIPAAAGAAAQGNAINPMAEVEEKVSRGSNRERLSPLRPNDSRKAAAAPLSPDLNPPTIAGSPLVRGNNNSSGRARNLLENNVGIRADEVSATTDLIGSKDDSDAAKVKAALQAKEAKKKGELFFEKPHALNASDFYTQIVEEGVSMGKMKDPSKVMRVEKVDHDAYMPSGKRAINRKPTDWSRVGVGGDRAPDDVGYGRGELDDRFLTTNSKFYPPLIYGASKPVTRDLVSESEINFKKKEFQRSERYARMKANMDVTKNRLEYEEVEKKVRALRRDHSRIEDRIRYQTAMFLNDLKCYKKNPLVRMARKQNIHLSDRMWNGTGSINGRLGKDAVETRDFASTYSASYDSQVLTMSDTLIPPRSGTPVAAPPPSSSTASD